MPKDYSAYSADLMKSLIAKLYATVTGADENVKIPRNKFVSWLLPGVPFIPEDFLYCAKGFSGADEQQKKDRYHQAFVLSHLLDFIPDVDNQFIDNTLQQTIFTGTEDTISSVYGDVLKYSRVVHKELSKEEKEKLQHFRDLLSVTKEEEDLITGEKKTVTEPGPLTIAYNTYMNNYLDEVDDYVNFLVSATADEIALKTKYIRKKMEAAEMAWVAQGYKNEYEQMTAYINQVTAMDMVLYKQDLLNKYNNGRLTSALDGASDFFYTTLIPGNFATSPGWTDFDFGERDYESHYDKETSQWGGSGGLNLGFFSIGGSAGGSKVEVNTDFKATNFSAKLKFTQVPICRPWFEPGFFTMRGWTLDKLWDLNFDKKVSDGAGGRPVGRLVAYPVTALFVKEVALTFNEADARMQYKDSQFHAGGSFSWGPLSLGGSYSRGQEKMDVKSHTEYGGIVVEGMQLIGFICNLIPKSPNPKPELKPEDFVGGAQ
ncbi:MAG: hypothetical protein U0V70_22195 [Terriglobia bacterium]